MGIFGKSEEKKAAEAAHQEHIKGLWAKLRDIKEERESLSKLLFAETSNLAAESEAYKRAVSPKWEYKVFDDINEAQINELGASGWELAGLASYATGGGVAGSSFMKVHVRYSFKRPDLEMSNYPEPIQAMLKSTTELAERLRAVDQDIKTTSGEINAPFA